MAACAQCGEDNPERARFCLNCGAPLGEAPQAARQERKLVSVLFVDLVGFTSRSDQTDPEDVRDTLERYHTRAKEDIEQYGGVVEKFIGDAVMAVFGAPLAHGDDAERAVRAGFRVLDSIEDLNRDDPQLELQARAAVNTGDAVVAVGTDSRSGEALAMGDVVNTASRLQGAAPPGRLIVGEATYRATRATIRYEEFPAVDAKGKRDPVPAWLAVEPLVAPAERPVGKAPMVGRDREMSLLASLWERAVGERRPHLVTMIGPPGIGKSRLHGEFASSVAANGGRVLRGRCLPYEERAAYGAFGQQVRQVAGMLESDPPDVAQEKLVGALGRFLPEAESGDVPRYLSLLLGLGAEGSTDERVLLFYAARRFVESLGLDQPTLVLFEDIHWAGPSLLDLVDYLASHVRDTPVLFVAVARPELLDHRPTWGSGLGAQTTITLEPLSASDAATIASHLLAEATGMEAAIERLVGVAEGNPLFVEELTSSLIEGPFAKDELPTTVRAAIAARIDALPPDPRAALLDASVIGKTFWRGALETLGSLTAVDAALDALESRDFVRREPTSQVAGDAEFTFKHILIRDVAYGTLPRATRRKRHAAIARYIEGSAKEHVPDLAWLLAHHWSEAGEPRRAIEYLLVAADRARQAWALDEVVELYERALELAGDEDTRTRIHFLRGLARVRLEDFQAADAELADLIPKLEGREQLEAILARSTACSWTEQADETMALARQAVDLAERLEAHDLVAPALARLSDAHGMRGEEGSLERAIEFGHRALELWPPDTRPTDLAEHANLLGDVHYWLGQYEQAARMCRMARGMSEDPRGAEHLLRGAGFEAMSLAAMGRYEEAFALFDETVARGREMGRPVRVILNYSTMALRDLFDLEEARRRTEESLEQSGWKGFSMPRVNALADAIQTDILLGDFGRALEAWPGAFEEAMNAKAWSRWLVSGRLLAARAELALRAEGPDAAAEWATKAIEAARPVKRLKYEGFGRIVLGRALLQNGRPDDAFEQLRLAVDVADRLGGPPGRWQSRAALSEALYATGDDDRAEEAFRDASAIVREVAAGLSPERAQRFLAAEPVSQLLARAGS
ncbi:MAG: AAA family ATPase [Actinomycetota bacterium]|nr:AAA family ATPase [Actinomycetota bacterium]